jgi:hypothetical protein
MANNDDIDYSFIIDLIETGQIDGMVDLLIDAAVSRRNFLKDMKAAANRATMSTGDRVRIGGSISPKYLIGVIGTVSPKPATRRGDIMVTLPYSVGRFHGTIGVPASCLELAS